MRSREHVQLLVFGDEFAGQRMQGRQPLDRVAEHLDAHRELFVLRDDLDGVAAHSERAAGERDVVAGVLDLDQLAKQLVALDLLAHLEPDHAVDVLLRSAKAVNARNARHHDDVAPRQQTVRGRVPQPLDLVVDRRVFLDVGIGLRDVGLGLVVVVVAHEVLDRVVRQHLAQLVGQLGRQRLVRRHHQGRPLKSLDQPGRRRRLARTGRAEQDGIAVAALDAALQIVDRGRLVARRREVADNLKRCHAAH